MMRGRPGARLEPLQTFFAVGTAAGLSDGQLLERFAGRRNTDADHAEAAFASLVARHGRMVRRVCRSLLADPHDAEDVFQAVFLVLARRAGSIRRPELLGNWLYGTAHRTARKLKVRSARRVKHEATQAAMAGARIATDAAIVERQAIRREEVQLVHEELARLPDVCRAAVVLCELEGHSYEEAARRLRCSERTVRRHLSRARDLLRNRLTRRGLAPTATAGLLTTALAPEPASAAIPQIAVAAVARAATRFAAGQAAAGTVTTVAEGAITTMFIAKLKGIALAIGAMTAVVSGAVLLAQSGHPGSNWERRKASTSADFDDDGQRDALREVVGRANSSSHAARIRGDLAAQKPKAEPAPERSVRRGPNHVLFAIKTDLQRRLIPDPDHADTYLFLNGPGLISDGVVNTAAFKLILLHVTRHQARAAKVYVRVFFDRSAHAQTYRPFQEALKALGPALRIQAIQMTGEWRNDQVTWQSRIADIDDKAIDPAGETEAGVGNETVRVYSIRTALSRFLIGDSDGVVVDFLKSASPNRPEIATAVASSIAKLELNQKGHIFFRVPHDSFPPAAPDFAAHERGFQDWDRLARSLGFAKSSITAK
jgi:RNA polymerase sigma factor (sigma-70 family)